MKAIIPTGGRGTRMRPITFSSNKHFIPVANRPLIYYPIEAVAKAGIKEVAVTYNPGGIEQAQQFLGDGSKWGIQITYILQEKPAGLANIVEVCEEYLAGDTFVFHLGDNIFLNGIRQAVDYFQQNKPNGLVTMIHHAQNSRMGVPYFDDKGQLVKYVEKPENPPHDFAVPGLYFGDANFFKCFKGEDRLQPSTRGEYEIPAAYQWMIDHGYKIDVIEYKGKWLDPGKYDDWLETNRYILDEKLEGKLQSTPDENCIIEGRVRTGKGCQIENSQIRGPVTIGDNVIIKNSYVGPFTSIADDCVIEDSHIENSVVMNKAKIQKVDRPIDTSIIGVESEVKRHTGPTSAMKLFIGEKSSIEI
jgi:glucose-1-phosphate thymidylyltransferase